MKKYSTLAALIMSLSILIPFSTLTQESKEKAVNIIGAGILNQDEYEKVMVKGLAKSESDLTVGQMTCSGAVEIGGHLKVKSLKSDGTLKVDEGLEAEQVNSSGALNVRGTFQGQAVNFAGSLESDFIKGGSQNFSGSLKVKNSVTVKNFAADGALNIGGILTADQVAVRLGGDSSIYEIDAKTIEIRPLPFPPPNFLTPKESSSSSGDSTRYGPPGTSISVDKTYIPKDWRRPPKMTVESMEGDSIYIENVNAQTVDGRRVVIGPGCYITNISYSDQLIFATDTFIGSKRRKIP